MPQIFVSLGAFLLFVLLAGLTYQSHSAIGDVSTEFDHRNRPELALGTHYVSSSKMPMQGIRMLKEVLQKNPQDTATLRILGNFSQRSGQYQKAAMRYESLLKYTLVSNSEQRLKDYARLEFFYVQTGKTDRALNVLDRMKKEFKGHPELLTAIKTRRKNILMNFKK